MSIIEAIVLGIVEGVTEFLPISSTGHLTITEKLLGFNIDDADITAFTAIVQIGAVAAVVIYFWSDLWAIVAALVGGLVDAASAAARASSGSGSRSRSARSRSRSPGSRCAT